MSLFGCLPVSLRLPVCIWLPACMSLSTCLYLSVCLSVSGCLPVCLCQPACLSLFACLSLCLFPCVSNGLPAFVRLSVYLLVCLVACPTAYLVCLSDGRSVCWPVRWTDKYTDQITVSLTTPSMYHIHFLALTQNTYICLCTKTTKNKQKQK